MIIFVGCRVNSKQGTEFRIWATNVLRKHLIDGYTINEKRLKSASDKYYELQKTISLLGNVVTLEVISDETRGIIKVITDYTRALEILDKVDHEQLSVPRKTTKGKYCLTYEEARKVIEAVKKKFKDSGLVGREKDDSFRSSLGAIYQTFDGRELYPSIEEKAAHLLYFVTKKSPRRFLYVFLRRMARYIEKTPAAG